MPPPPEPPHEEVLKLRESTLAQLEKDGILETLDPIDIDRFKNDDLYVKRFLMHHHNKQDLAQTMAIGALKWRKESGANYITEDSIDMTIVDKAVLFIHNRDKDGCKMLQFCVRKHIKSVDPDIVKKIMIYWVERLEREEKGKWMTVVFDMQETGIRHMDMDLIQYTINLFKFYYPFILNYILVIEMPWLLNAMWKIIKSWLPPEALEKIKFVDKKQLLTYVPIEQCSIAWGGTDETVFKFTSEVNVTPTSSIEEEIEPFDEKKVHFAESTSSTVSSTKATATGAQTESGNLCVDVLPVEELVFPTNRVGSIATITVKNCGSSSIAFKIKTTAPDKYRVRPSVGTCAANGKEEVVVTLCETLSTALLVRDKFLVLVIATPDANIVPDGQLFKEVSREDLLEVKLRIGIENADTPPTTVVANHVNPPQTMVVPAALTDKLNEIVSKQADLQREVNSSRRLMLITLLAMVAILIYVIISTNNTTSLLLHKGHLPLKKTEEL